MKAVCDAILEFPDGTFVMCEKDKGHEGNHRGLFWEWLGEGVSKAPIEDKRTGDELMKLVMLDIAISMELCPQCGKVWSGVDMFGFSLCCNFNPCYKKREVEVVKDV